MNAEEFAIYIDDILVEAADDGLPIEEQIAVLERLLAARKAALSR